jgi:hypothetical protein
MQIKILTAHHNRPKITELFYLGVERLKQDYDIQVVAACTIGDNKSIEVAKKYGAEIHTHPNVPLGKKWNNAWESIKDGEDCCVLIMGDDDLISSEAVGIYYDRCVSGRLVVGMSHCTMYNSDTHEAMTYSYNPNIEKCIGAGRMFCTKYFEPRQWVKSIRAITVGAESKSDACEFFMPSRAIKGAITRGEVLKETKEIWQLWYNDINNGMDRSSDANLSMIYGYDFLAMTHKENHLIDFKSNVNITSWDAVKKRSKPTDVNGCLWFLGDAEIDYIRTNFWK